MMIGLLRISWSMFEWILKTNFTVNTTYAQVRSYPKLLTRSRRFLWNISIAASERYSLVITHIKRDLENFNFMKLKFDCWIHRPLCTYYWSEHIVTTTCYDPFNSQYWNIWAGHPNVAQQPRKYKFREETTSFRWVGLEKIGWHQYWHLSRVLKPRKPLQ